MSDVMGEARPARRASSQFEAARAAAVAAKDRAYRDQAVKQWHLKNARLKAARASADEILLHYPQAHLLVTVPGVGRTTGSRRLHAVRDREGSDLWVYDPTRADDPLRVLSDNVCVYDMLRYIPLGGRARRGARPREHVFTIEAVHAAHDRHQSEGSPR